MALQQFKQENFRQGVSPLSQTERNATFQTLKHLFHMAKLENYVQINVAKAKTCDSVSSLL